MIARRAGSVSGVYFHGPMTLSKACTRSFTNSAYRYNNKQEHKQSSRNEPPPGKTPIQVFIDVFRQEWKSSDALKSDIKQLQDATGKMGESDAFKRAKEAYEQAQKGSTIVGKTLKKTGEKIGDVAEAAWESEVGKTTRQAVNKTAEKVDEAFEPVRKTQAYKDISEVIDDGSSVAYGGFVTKEQRRRKREEEIRSGKRRVIQSNNEAPTALTTTDYKPEKPKFSERWENFKDTNPVGKLIADLRSRWDESENGFISAIRTIFEKIGGFFAETERGRVIKQLRLMDPTFNSEDFLKNLREYMVPEILEAYIRGDEPVLKQWLGEISYNVWKDSTKDIRSKGIFSDGKVVDIRRLEIYDAKLLPPNDVPVLIVRFQAQELNIYRDIKSHKIVAGSPNDVIMRMYVMAFTRDPEQLGNKETEGWIVSEMMAGRGQSYT